MPRPSPPTWCSLVLSVLLAASSARAEAHVDHYALRVDGMTSPFAAYGLERALRAVPGVDRVEIDFARAELRAYVAPQANVTPAEVMRAAETTGRAVATLSARACGTVRGPASRAALAIGGRTFARLAPGPAHDALTAFLRSGKRSLCVDGELRRGPASATDYELVVQTVELDLDRSDERAR